MVVVGSITGAPGVTTTALALATAWPPEADSGVRPVVVEADSSGGDLMIRFGLPPAPSLLDVAAAARQPHPGSLLGAVSELPFRVRVVTAVPGHGPMIEAVRLLAAEAGRRVLLGEDSDRGTVLLDVGRLTGDVTPLLEAADQVVLVARGGAEPLTHVSTYGLDDGLRERRLTLAVVGPCPYQPGEITATLGIGRVVIWPWDTRSVAVLSSPGRRALRCEGLRTPPLMAAARLLAHRLVGAREDEPAAPGKGSDREAGGSGARRLAGPMWTGLVPVPGDDGSDA
nr:hypothetical protein [Streptomyces sp. CBMA152]